MTSMLKFNGCRKSIAKVTCDSKLRSCPFSLNLNTRLPYASTAASCTVAVHSTAVIHAAMFLTMLRCSFCGLFWSACCIVCCFDILICHNSNCLLPSCGQRCLRCQIQSGNGLLIKPHTNCHLVLLLLLRSPFCQVQLQECVQYNYWEDCNWENQYILIEYACSWLIVMLTVDCVQCKVTDTISRCSVDLATLCLAAAQFVI